MPYRVPQSGSVLVRHNHCLAKVWYRPRSTAGMYKYVRCVMRVIGQHTPLEGFLDRFLRKYEEGARNKNGDCGNTSSCIRTSFRLRSSFSDQASQWPVSDRSGTTQWPLSDHSVTAQWPLSDHSMMSQWRLNDHSVTSQWPVSDFVVTTQWPFGGLKSAKSLPYHGPEALILTRSTTGVAHVLVDTFCGWLLV